MPSDKPTDERAATALQVLEKAREDYHSALVATSEELRGMLDAGSATAEARAERTAAELGAFAVGHIDIERFASFEETGEPVTVTEAPRIEAAARTLESLLERGSDLHFVRVEPGSDLRDATARALARAGRAFGAARTVELARSGKYDEGTHGGWLDSFPPFLWSRRERELAPPLVIEVDGADLRAEGLAEFLDGRQKIVLVVRGECAPAPLARLVTPDVFVTQTNNAADFQLLAEFEGPALGALVPQSAARFVHDPRAGGETWQRLAVAYLPEKEPKGSIGGLSGFQQAQELRQLKALAAEPVGAPAPAGEPGAAAAEPLADPVDKLAAWLLTQADLSDAG